MQAVDHPHQTDHRDKHKCQAKADGRQQRVGEENLNDGRASGAGPDNDYPTI
jgi:hypothetical protein